jgi:TPR repeat protein
MKMKWCVTCLLVLVLCAGVMLHAQQSETNAIESIKAKAEKGDAAAQCILGNFYSLGLGVTRDIAEAAILYRKAAEQNYARAQYNLLAFA